MTGLPPLTYVRSLRLNVVRRQLRSNTARPISCIAYDWGFSHLSQFAQDYRRLLRTAIGDLAQLIFRL